MAHFELDVWSGDFGLPSIDPQCLAVMTYCKFAAVAYDVRFTNKPQKSPTGELPAMIISDSEALTNINDIFNYLRKNSMGTDYDLTTKQSADIVAFTAMLEEKLVPGLMQLYWSDSKTYSKLTWPWFVKNMNFPYNYSFPYLRHRQNTSRLAAYSQENVTIEEIESKIYRDAKECLNSLSAKLGENDFFFGAKPSSLDAILFGYLAPLLKSTVPTPVLQNHLKACPNLCRLCDQVLENYFPDIKRESTKEKMTEGEQKEETSDFPHSHRNIALSAAVAIVAMSTYAAFSGILRVSVR